MAGPGRGRDRRHVVSVAAITGLVSGLTALAAAVGGIIALFRHANGPAHQAPAVPVTPATPTAAGPTTPTAAGPTTPTAHP
jgi:hypothetical protein